MLAENSKNAVFSDQSEQASKQKSETKAK